MFFKKNRKTKFTLALLLVFLVVTGVVFIDPQATYAGVGDVLIYPIKVLLYGVFVAVGLLASVGITIFEWAINPNFISGPAPFGFFNSPGVYAMWKFVRDFFNLFFILTFLYIAFTIVFQIAGNYKKEILSLVLAALFVNFSFPVTRFMIDASNVPMYFFANEMGGGASSPGKALGSTLKAASIKDILIPGSGEGIGSVKLYSDEGVGVAQLLLAIVFLFIFSISLVTIGIMMVIRMATLLILLIFSSVGFAASVVPGLSKYSKDWWEAFIKNAIFGPVIMLMLFVVTRLFAETSNGILKDQLLSTSQNASTGAMSSFTAAMAQFAIPIVLLWIAIGVAKSSSLAGAGTIMGKGQDFTKWLGKKVTYNNSLGRGLGSGIKSRVQDSKVGKFFKGTGATEAALKGWAKKTNLTPWGKGTAGAKSELQKLKDKQINEQVKKNKEESLSRSAALSNLDPAKGADEVTRIASAISLAQMDNGIQNMDDLSKALAALQDPSTGKVRDVYKEKAVEIVGKADKKVVAPSAGKTGLENLKTVVDSLGDNQKAINDLIGKLEDSAFSGTGAQYGAVRDALVSTSPALEGALEARVRKEGEAKILVDYEVSKGASIDAAVDGVLSSMKSIKDIVAAKSLFQDPRYQASAVNYVRTQPLTRRQEIIKTAAQESPAVFALI